MKLTINRKLTLFTGLVVVLLVLICVSIIGSFSRIKGIIETSVNLKEAQVNVVKLQDAEKSMLLWEMASKEFFESGTSVYQRQFIARLNQI